MPPLEPVTGQHHDNDDDEAESDSEEEYDPDQHLWNAGSSSWQNPASSRVGNSQQARLARTLQAQVGKTHNGSNGITGIAKTSSTRTQIGGRTTKAEEKMIKMVNIKFPSQELCEQAP